MEESYEEALAEAAACNHYIAYVIPWKLLLVDLILQEKHDGEYVEKYKHKISFIYDQKKIIDQLPEDERWSEFNRIFSDLSI